MPDTLRDNLARSRHVHRLAETLRALFRRQAMEVASRVTLDGPVPELTHWIDPIAQAAQPTLLRLTQQGIAETQVRLLRRGVRYNGEGDGVRRHALPVGVAFKLLRGWHVRKAADAKLAFDLWNPRVIDAVDAATFRFCRETMDTARSDLATSLAKLRRALRAGLKRGDAMRKLAEDVHRIFADPARAYRIAVTECLTGDTLIRGANVSAVYRRQYVGPIVEVIVEGGEKLTGTPNHPVLTHRGWVGLGDLQETDYVVCDASSIDYSRFMAADVNEKQPPITINEILDLGTTVWVNSRQRTAHPDFHGDGMDSYVDVFDSSRLLRFGIVASRQQLLEDGFLTPPDQVGRCAVCQGDRFSLLRGVHDAECFEYGSNGNAGLTENPFDDSCSDLGGTQTARVKFNRLLSLRVIENWNGHVFNLETQEGFYNANGYYTKNSSRAQHAGQLMAAKESGVVKKKSWVASSDACELCLGIMGRGPVGLNEPFHIERKGGPYSVIHHPPAHPFLLL